MRCREVMKKEVSCVSPRDTVEDAASKMRDDNVGFLPVCDQSKRVVGTLTDRDLAIRCVAGNKPVSTHIEDVMTKDVVHCSPDDDIETAERLMSEHHKSRIICIDNGYLAGVISLSDIAQVQPDRASDMLREISSREARA